MLSQLAHFLSHIRADLGYRSNRSQQSDGTEIFSSQRAIFVRGWASESRKDNAYREYQKLQRVNIETCEYDYAGLKPLHPVLQILKAWCRLCMQ